MTLRDCVESIMTDRPSPYDEERITGWINEIEAYVQADAMKKTEDADIISYDYTNTKDRDKTLLVQRPFDANVYPYYVKGKMAIEEGDYAEYNNMMQMFNSFYDDYKAWYRLNNKPDWGYNFRNYMN